jgi:GH35 family endo-1,4-beta-xylanase
MTFVLKQIGLVLAIMVLFVPCAFPQTKDDSETLRQAAQKSNFWVGTTIQGRMWNRDPEYKPVLGREFNAAVSIVFQGITQPERGRFNWDPMDEAMRFAKQNNIKLMGHCLV